MNTASVAARHKKVAPPIWFIYGVSLTGILGTTVITPLLPDILNEFSRTKWWAGVLVGVTAAPGILMAPVIGFLADRFGRKNVLLPCLFVFGSFGMACAFVNSFEMLIVFRFLQGFGAAGLINLAVVLIGDFWEGVERTKQVGRNNSVITVGLAIVPFLAGLVGEFLSWRWACGMFSFGMLVGFVGVIALQRQVLEEPEPLAAQLVVMRTATRDPLLMTTYLSGLFLFMSIFGVFLTAVPLVLEDVFSLSSGWRGAVLALPAISSSIASFNLTAMQKRFGKGSLLRFAPQVFVLSFLVLALGGSVWMLVVGAFVYGFAEGMFIPALQDIAVSTTTSKNRGVIMALWVSSVRLGQTIGPLAIGAADRVMPVQRTILLGVAAMAVVLMVQKYSLRRRLIDHL